MIEKEVAHESQKPQTFLRESDKGSSVTSNSTCISGRFEKMIRDMQNTVCLALEQVDGAAKFKEDVWSRPGGGGGISRVLQDGAVWEKAAVNVSVVYGVMPPDIGLLGPLTMEMSCLALSHFLLLGLAQCCIQKIHLHQLCILIIVTLRLMLQKVQKTACDKFGASFYPRFKKWCDDYFYIKHRGERRGLGGIFFDDLNDYDQDMLLSFSTECANSVVPAYIPIIEKRKNTPFTDELRRGRYVEFNLVYDRGTTFGLKTGGRIESILVSLPLTARWEYDHQPEEGTEEWKLLDACINPREWI